MMQEFTIGSTDLDAWMAENKAEYTGEFSEGVLLDNFILSTPEGYAAFYEEPVNCWTSRYRVEYVTGADMWENGEADALWARFMEFAAKSETAA